jgi:chemotaxis protein histidine kinase CheA
MSNTFDKLSVLDSFIEEVNSYLPEIEANLERLTQSPGDMEALEETYRRTHTIGGSASMMDFPGLAHVAHGMEDILGDVLDGLASLDQSTIELLQRSLARLHRLVGGIQHGIDENAVVAEDDEDYARYRAHQDTSAQDGPNGAANPASVQQIAAPISPMPDANSLAISSLDEMLSSFRTPVKNGEIPWPEEPLIRAEFPPRPDVQLPVPPMQPMQHAQFDAQIPRDALKSLSSPSALEMLAGSNRPTGMSSSMPVVSPTPRVPSTPRPQISDNDVYAAASANSQAPILPVQPPVTSPPVSYTPPEMRQESPIQSRQSPPLSLSPQPSSVNMMRGVVLSSGTAIQSEVVPSLQVYYDMQSKVGELEDQATSLQRMLAHLRLATSVIETQRAEFKGFLDGSRDALDRMEDWAGKAMGLNLRNSPEQVRRYLPLSVMWVANNKLKKVLDVILQMSSGVEGTEGKMRVALQQLQVSIETCGEILQNPLPLPNETAVSQDAGWTPWEVQVVSDPNAVRERVTFERMGDPATMRAELEFQLREELREEYENRPVTLAARAELERQIREELRAELSATQQLQAQVVGVDATESLQDLETRLRHDIEIEVRNAVLSQIQLTGSPEGKAAPTASQEHSAASSLLESANQRLMPMASPPQNRPVVESAVMTSDFGNEATEIFRLEAEEHLQTISMYVATLERMPTDLEPMQGIRRATHTLKGAAGMMGFRAIADLCHISEDMLDGIMEGSVSISSTVLSLILDTAEALDFLITGDGSPAENDNAVQLLRERYSELLGERVGLRSGPEEELEIEAEQDIEHSTVSSVLDSEAQPVESTISGSGRSDLSVRVSLSKLDELVNLFGELLVNRTVLEERIQRLTRLVVDTGVSSARLRDVGQKLESRFEAATLPSGRSVQVMPGEGDQNVSSTNGSNVVGRNGRVEAAHLAEFDELELDRYTEFHQLARGLSEGISDMTTLSAEMEAAIRECEGVFGRESRLSTTFQDRLMKARLVPLSTTIPRLYRTARAVALKQHKEFELVLEGQETEVDRTVIEEIAGPLLHLMRNAVNHAIEMPEVRLQQGKPAAGQIKLSASYEGNRVVITVRDDGTGIDPERIRSEAISRGLIHPNQVLNDNDIIELIFRPSFSTAKVLSEESGRGVGLDVVRDSVSRLRGTLEVESMPGQGTAFTMRFPTSLAIQNTMMVQVADQQFAIPTVMVEAIGRLDTYKHVNYGGRPAIYVQNQHYPLSSLAQLLGLPVSDLSDKAPILLVRTDRHRVALVVDDIKGRMDVVIKNLGPHLRNVHGVAGGTVLGNGRVVLILELLELLSTRAGVRGSLAASGYAAPAHATEELAVHATGRVERRTTIAPSAPIPKSPLSVPQGKHILVVDDSPSVRRVVSNMLKQHQWEVQMARDGVEALEMISQEAPAAVLLDIEMPRMDGYELMATIRAQEQYRALPLVVLTSRAASKHQQRAMQLGASAYVVKPYQDEELINILNTLVYGAGV